MPEEIRSNTLKRICGKQIQIEACYDTVQRGEWFSTPDARSVGRLTTGKWSPAVHAYRYTPSGAQEHFVFSKHAFGNSKPRALTAARQWISQGGVA